jgi:hypothetical protein
MEGRSDVDIKNGLEGVWAFGISGMRRISGGKFFVVAQSVDDLMLKADKDVTPKESRGLPVVKLVIRVDGTQFKQFDMMQAMAMQRGMQGMAGFPALDEGRSDDNPWHKPVSCDLVEYANEKIKNPNYYDAEKLLKIRQAIEKEKAGQGR